MENTSASATDLVDTSHVRVSLAPGRTKHIHLPIEEHPVPMGMHGKVANHYKIPLDEIEQHATTLDYIIGAAAGCLTGTFGGRLSALGQSVTEDNFTVRAEGDIVKEAGVLRLSAIRVYYHVRLSSEVSDEKVRRAHANHHMFCPVAKSIGASIDVTSHLELI